MSCVSDQVRRGERKVVTAPDIHAHTTFENPRVLESPKEQVRVGTCVHTRLSLPSRFGDPVADDTGLKSFRMLFDRSLVRSIFYGFSHFPHDLYLVQGILSEEARKMTGWVKAPLAATSQMANRAHRAAGSFSLN